MNAVDCTAFSPFNHEACLPPLPPLSPLADQSAENGATEQFPQETVKPRDPAVIIVPNVDWEYVAEYPLRRLRPHALQNDLFAGLNESAIKELAQDIQRRGLQNPLEILPDGTIVNGHQRFLAGKQLRRTHLPVYLRHDLAGQPKAVVEEHIVQDNLQRKNLHPLEIAQCYKRLRAIISADQGPQEDIALQIRDLRSDLARRFNISGRTLDRYVSALKAPWLIQCACIRGHVPMEQVSQIGRLSQNKMQVMMAMIETTGNLPVVVAEFARHGRGKQRGTVQGLIILTRRLKRDTAKLAEKLEQLPYRGPEFQDPQPTFAALQEFFTKLLELYENPPVRQAESEVQDKLSSEEAGE